MNDTQRGNRLGPYRLGARYRNTEDVGRIYRAQNTETGVPALVLQRTERQPDDMPLADWRVRVTSSVSPSYLALEVESAPASGLPADIAAEFVVMLGDAEELANEVVERHETMPHLRAARRPLPARLVVTPLPTPRPSRNWRRPSFAAGLAALAALAVLHLGGSRSGVELRHDVGAELAQTDWDAGWGDTAEVSEYVVLTNTVDDAPFLLARALPKRPFSNQKRAPCNPDIEVEIRGGCWVRLKQDAPCKGDSAYEYEGGCYLPAAKPVAAPTAVTRQPLAFDQP